MYKIQFLVILLLSGPVALLAQQPLRQSTAVTQSSTHGLAFIHWQVGKLMGWIQPNRQAVFTVHLLADLVEISQNHTYDTLTGGQKASLRYPTPCQIPSR